MYQTESSTPSARPRRLLSVLLGVMFLMLVAFGGLVAWRRAAYRAEIARLRAAMTDVERRTTDHVISTENRRMRVAVELLRRQARVEPALHLAVAVDSNAMYLEREGARLRTMPILIGPERTIGTAPDTVPMAAPRGVRTIAGILGPNDFWEVPAWLFLERGVTPPTDRSIRGALGSVALLLDGGTVVYALPASGPLSDSTYVLPGAVRARHDDLAAIAPSLTPGMRVYFH